MTKYIIFSIIALMCSTALALAEFGIGSITREIVEFSFTDTMSYVWDELMAAIKSFPDDMNTFTVALGLAVLSSISPLINAVRSLLKGKVTQFVSATIGFVAAFVIVGMVAGVIALAISNEKQHQFHWCHSVISKKLPDSMTGCDEELIK